jgi:hypothetical protein
MTLIERQEPSHWYLRDGRPFHEIASATGTGNRPVTLRDARKVMAFPSVTNVLGVLAKPGLDAWKIEQGIMAALTLPRLPDEPLDLFAQRVVEDMGAQVGKAAEFGSAIHRACEVYALNKQIPTEPKVAGCFEPWRQWFDENVERVGCMERVFVHHEHGYAGRVDMVALLRGIGWAVVDFKTQKVKRSPKGEVKPAFYETWPLQLAAYRQAILVNGAKNVQALVSVVIDSAAPGPVHTKVWNSECRVQNGHSGGSYVDYFGSFLAAVALWKYVKGYDPVGPGKSEGRNPKSEIQMPGCERPELN